jgi:drug/metabolite transporter (DMT)-like permease
MTTCADAYTPRDTRNLRIFNVWCIASAVMFVGVTFLIKKNVVPNGPLAWGLAIANLVVAFLAVRSYMLFLRSADELLRRIQLEGLALGFGAGAVFMLSYRIFERLGAPTLDSADPFVVMAIFWALGQYIGLRRYAPGMER